VNRQRLLWTVATRVQLERWEPLVAASLLDSFAGRQPDDGDVWSAAIEHHFALVAAHHLLQALKLPPAAGVPVDEILRAELIEGRHLHEHWEENLPVFNVNPPPKQPKRRSGKAFAARNPGRSPYWWLGWSNQTGARLLPNVTAPALHRLLDDVEAEVLASDPALSRFVPPRAPSPWLYEGGEWWPKSKDDV
jgi:hypothetical protein